MLHKGLCVHEIILTGNCFYNSLHRKFNMRARDPISHTRVKTKSHTYRCWRATAMPTNVSSRKTFTSLTQLYIRSAHPYWPGASGVVFSAHRKLWSFQLVIKICHTDSDSALSLFWNVLVQEQRAWDAIADLCPIPTEGAITGPWCFFTLSSNTGSRAFSASCSRQQLTADWCRHASSYRSVALSPYFPVLVARTPELPSPAQL